LTLPRRTDGRAPAAKSSSRVDVAFPLLHDGRLTMTNLPSASSLTDAVFPGDLSASDAASAVTDVAVEAKRRGAGLARRTLKLGTRGGSIGARATYVGARATARGIGRGTAGTVRVARRHPKLSAGLVAAILALIAAYAVSRRSAASTADEHLSTVG
jgi:hypothetical protein